MSQFIHVHVIKSCQLISGAERSLGHQVETLESGPIKENWENPPLAITYILSPVLLQRLFDLPRSSIC
jgi:hypothetical protein